MAGTINDARSILNEAKQQLLHCSNVVATGIGYKISGDKTLTEPSLICSVSKKLATVELSRKDLIPKSFDGIPTDVVASGIIRAFAPQTDRLRPVPGGISIGHFDITAGTLGCWVKRGAETYLLSNNHVIANSNDARRGDSILQPGPIDGGERPGDVITTLAEFIPIFFPGDDVGGGDGGNGGGNGGGSTCQIANGVAAFLNTAAEISGSQARLRAITTRSTENLVDAAIAGPVDPSLVDNSILGIGDVQGVVEAELGMAVQKSGRTTGYTTDVIQQIDVTVNVQYGGGRVGQFSDQLIAGAMSQGGDSGSAVLDMENNIVGLLFAGSDNVTIMNRIQNVFTALNISL